MTKTTDHSASSEADFLDAQMADAQSALHETWNDLKGTLRETASLEVWAKRHPWMVTGAAVAGGFLLATLLLSPSGSAEPEPQPEDADDDEQTPRRHSLAWLTGPLFGLLRPMLGQIASSVIAAILGALGGSMAASADDTASDGMEESAPPEGPVPA
jgi:hypothetical protein